ncbi:MAG: YfiR family protein [Desulfobacterales bacterium]|nr:YfiR family protein [Desulfobacterales bacterium]
MTLQRYILLFILTLEVVAAPRSLAMAEPFAKVPEKLQAAILIKILAMSKEINNGEDISIHVVNAPDAAAELRKAVGRKIGKSTLVAVSEGPTAPLLHPSALYIGDKDNARELIRYCRENRVLSITGAPELVARGVTLGLGMAGDRPRILLNAAATNAENITWNPTLLKISKIYR